MARTWHRDTRPFRRWLVGTVLTLVGGAVIHPGTAQTLSGSWWTGAPLPAPRWGLGAATGPDGRIYAIGGGYAGSHKTVYAYDPASNHWTSVAPLLTARFYLGTTAGPDGRIYAVAGSAGFSVNTPENWLATVEAYNPAANRWSAVAPLPTDRYGPAATTGPDGHIYVLGGLTRGDTPATAVAAYDPATSRWITLAPMSTSRSKFAAVSDDGRIYALGGLGTGDKRLGSVEAYDPATNRWSTVAPLPTPRAELAAAAVGGLIYTFGGFGEGDEASLDEAASAVEVYDPATNSWACSVGDHAHGCTSRNLPPLPTGRWDMAATVGSDGRIYLLGGTSSRDTRTSAYETVYVFTPGMASTPIPSPTPTPTPTPTPPPPKDQIGGTLRAVTCVTGTDCWAVGTTGFSINGYLPGSEPVGRPEIVHWNGIRWSIVKTPIPPGDGKHPGMSLVSVTCASRSNCWAVGFDQQTVEPSGGHLRRNLALHWNGTGWTVAPIPQPAGTGFPHQCPILSNCTRENQLYEVACNTVKSCWAVGVDVKEVHGYAFASQLLHWNGSTWSATSWTGLHSDELLEVACPTATRCWSTDVQGLLTWDGRGWRRFPVTAAKSVLQGQREWYDDPLACPAANVCWFAGEGAMLHLVGSTLSRVTISTLTSGNQVYMTPRTSQAITCESNSNCWVAGPASNAWRWNGSTWAAVPMPAATQESSGTTAPRIYDVACGSATECWAVGQDTAVKSQIVRWNGRAWTAYNPPPS